MNDSYLDIDVYINQIGSKSMISSRIKHLNTYLIVARLTFLCNTQSQELLFHQVR